MTASALQLLGMVLACGGAAVALLASDRRLRYVAAGIALVAAPAVVAGDVWHTSRLVELRHDPAKLAAAALAGSFMVAVGAAIFRRLPWAFPVAVFVTLPLRVPVQVAGQTAHLLVPLYVVIAAGFVCFAYDAIRARGEAAPGSGDPVPGRTDPPALVWLYRVLAVTLVLYAVQSAYSADVSNAIENAAFFLVPFAVLFVLLGEVRWTEPLLGRVLLAVAALGVGLAAVAFWEYAARDLIQNQDLLQSNQLHLYFRVNSLFFDPNIFGRYLALILVALGAYLAWGDRSPTRQILAAIASGAMLAALALSYSITSVAALVAGLLVVVALRWSVRWAVGSGVAILVCGALFLLATGAGQTDLSSAKNANNVIGGRGGLISGGVRLVRDRPVWGWGSGSFGAAFTRHIQRTSTSASHTEPLTVAAEQGAIGLAVYAALVVLALLVLLSGAGGSAGAAAMAACFVALIVHSLGYAGFAIDPATWALLGVGIGLRRGGPAPAPVRAVEGIGDPDAPSSPRDPRPAPV